MPRIVLASASPRRAKILSSLGVEFDVVKTDAPEASHPGDPGRTVRENALAKWRAASARPGIDAKNVLAADTIVWFDGRIYGKPRDLDEAKEFLSELSGRTHCVFTGVVFGGEAKIAESRVKFRELSRQDIDGYVASVRPLDRAGAYDIDESGGRIVEYFEGEYENIMGLPVAPLREWGIAK